MGCTQSKVIEAADVYRPAPTSFALFDINTVEEPWVTKNGEDNEQEQQQEKVVHVPVPLLEKLDKFELQPHGPHSWSEVSKALEDLKPTFNNHKTISLPKPEPVNQDKTSPPKKLNQQTQKSLSFHTLEELDTKVSPKPTDPKKPDELVKKNETKLIIESQRALVVVPPDSESYKPVKENLFILKDRLEREREGKVWQMRIRQDPLSQYPEKCPPGGSDSIVLYTTTLSGVRRTFEDCNRARSIIDLHGVMFDERNVSLHGGFLNELRELLGEGVRVPRLFIKGRYIGGVDEVVELNERSRLKRLLDSVGKNREVWNGVCEGCGGARFTPCWECGGSCKVLIDDKKQRCSKCNENGLVQCPVCH